MDFSPPRVRWKPDADTNPGPGTGLCNQLGDLGQVADSLQTLGSRGNKMRACQRGSLGSYQLVHSAVKAAGTKATRSPACPRGAAAQNSCCSTPFAARQQEHPCLHATEMRPDSIARFLNNLLLQPLAAQSFPSAGDPAVGPPQRSGAGGAESGNPKAAPLPGGE